MSSSSLVEVKVGVEVEVSLSLGLRLGLRLKLELITTFSGWMVGWVGGEMENKANFQLEVEVKVGAWQNLNTTSLRTPCS